MIYLIDTDTCIDVLRGDRAVRDRLWQASPDDVGIASMTLAELLFGAQQSKRPEVEVERTRAFVDVIEWVDFDGAAAAHHADIRAALMGKPIGERDLVIAATARANGLVLVTGNTREFSRVPDLSVERW